MLHSEKEEALYVSDSNLKVAEEMAKKPNYITVPAAIRELDKIEMSRQLDGVYRLDHAVAAIQKAIMKSDKTYEEVLEFFGTETVGGRSVMAAKPIEGIVKALEEIVDQNGAKYLTDEPYQIYKKLLESGTVDRKTAAALLYVLSGGLLEAVDPGCDVELLSGSIRRECSLNKRMADRLAIILYTLYSEDNKRKWRRKEQEGLSLFLQEEFLYDWEGFAVWDAGNGTVDCHYNARIILNPTKSVAEDKDLVKQLRKNPFTTKEKIHDLFARRLQEYLDHEFDYYCTCEDYYQPVVEDYGNNLAYDLQKWSKENGFEFVSCEGDGGDNGYEPKFRNDWY